MCFHNSILWTKCKTEKMVLMKTSEEKQKQKGPDTLIFNNTSSSKWIRIFKWRRKGNTVWSTTALLLSFRTYILFWPMTVEKCGQCQCWLRIKYCLMQHEFRCSLLMWVTFKIFASRFGVWFMLHFYLLKSLSSFSHVFSYPG